MKKMFLCIGTVLAAAVLLASCGGGNTGSAKSESPGAVVEKAFKLMIDKKYDKVAELYLSGDDRKLTEEERTKIEGLVGMAAAQHANKSGIKEVVVVEETIAEDQKSARVKYTIIYNDDREENEKANLVNLDGKWYMSLKMN